MGEAGVAGGVAEASATAGVYESAGVIPVLGPALLSFGAGVGIGTEICGWLDIEGCWTFGATDADPELGGSYHWEFFTTDPIERDGSWPYAWYLYQGGGLADSAWWGHGGVVDGDSSCGVAPVSGASKFLLEAESTFACSYGSVLRALPMRYSLENRTFTYTGADNPAVSNYGGAFSEDWSEDLATEIAGAPDGSPKGKVGQKIASEIPGSEVSNPYAAHVEVPSCDGLLVPACVDLLEGLDLVPDVDTRTWETADVEQPAGTVLDLDPETDATVETGTIVTIDANPDEEDMPVVVPARLPGETYANYISRLAEKFDPTRVTVAPDFTDPSTGPDGVIRTVPKEGTRTDPDIETDLDVHTNPADAPAASNTAAWSPPAVSPIDLTPLQDVHVGCNTFPFGVFCWVSDGLTDWGTGASCPSFSVPFVSEIRHSEDDLVFDTCTFQPAMDIIRPVIVILSFFGMAWLLAASAMGLGGGSGVDD